jgi:zinc protease
MTPDEGEHGFLTDQQPATGDPTAQPSATVIAHVGADLSVLDSRPQSGPPRDYHFPRFERSRLANGLTVLSAHVPGRALLAAQLIFPGGAWTEPVDQAGVTMLTARALPEGTQRRNAVEFIEAAERLGAEIHASASWEAMSAALEVPRARFGAALALLTEMCFEPAFPADEVTRLRDERLNDLLQAWADPRRRSERVFPETIYSPASPYSRPLGGIPHTIRPLERDAIVERHGQLLDPSTATLVIAGDLTGLAAEKLAEQHLGSLPPALPGRGEVTAEQDIAANPAGAQLVLVDRPGAPQSELRIGHIGVPRRTDDFHAISVLNAILGGTFNSRLNRVIREEKGYSYGIHSSFDMRGHAGPFAIRTAVETAVTAPAIVDTLQIVRAIREAPVTADEIGIARDYLEGVFPLRFETAGQVAAALSGLVVLQLPDDELDRYRPMIARVSQDDVLAAARRHIRPDDMSIVVVGDASQVEAPLREAGLGELTVVPADASPG